MLVGSFGFSTTVSTTYLWKYSWISGPVPSGCHVTGKQRRVLLSGDVGRFPAAQSGGE